MKNLAVLNMKATHKFSKYIIILLVLIVAASASIIIVSTIIEMYNSKSAETKIILRAFDQGEINHVEFIPKPIYLAESLTCSELSKELLLNAFYGSYLDEDKLSFILACKRNGYYSKSPGEFDFDAESTLYASWLMKLLGLKPELNTTILFEKLSKCETFTEAYYLAMTLKLLGINVDEKLLEDFNLKQAVSPIRGSFKPSLKATAMWISLFKDLEKAEWLAEISNGGVKVRAEMLLENYNYSEIEELNFKEWFNIETLIIFKPVFINVTVSPSIIVNEMPKISSLKAVKWPNNPVKEYFFSWRSMKSNIESILKIDGRKLFFNHSIIREEAAPIIFEKLNFHSIRVKCKFKPPYRLILNIGGLKFHFQSDSYEKSWILNMPLTGRFKVEAIIKSDNIFLKGIGFLEFEIQDHIPINIYMFIFFPFSMIIVAGVGCRGWSCRFKVSMMGLTFQIIIALIFQRLRWINLQWFTLTFTATFLAALYVKYREVFNVSVDHLTVLAAILSASTLNGNLLILILSGLGSMLFLISAFIYPSERDKTEKLYKSSMLIYSFGIFLMGLIDQVAVEIACLLRSPSEGFIDALRMQAMMASNLIALTPILAPIIHLARLIHAFERGVEAADIIRRIEE